MGTFRTTIRKKNVQPTAEGYPAGPRADTPNVRHAGP